MRLMQRTTVDLPEPDGPISAVALLGSEDSDSALMACRSPYHASRPAISTVRAMAAADALWRLAVMRSGAGASGGSISGSVTMSLLMSGGSCAVRGGRRGSGSG